MFVINCFLANNCRNPHYIEKMYTEATGWHKAVKVFPNTA